MLGMSGRAYQNGFTVSCGFTHRRAWQTFMQSNHTKALILEDDAICKNINVDNVIKEISMINKDWEFIQLGRCWDFCKSQNVLSKTPNFKIIKSESPCCSHAYIINKKGAYKLLKYSLPHITSLDLFLTLLKIMYWTGSLLMKLLQIII